MHAGKAMQPITHSVKRILGAIVAARYTLGRFSGIPFRWQAMTSQIFTAQDIANYLLTAGLNLDSPLSNLKLQKMLYYAQGWHLAVKGTRLFADKIEAWIHGPVVPSVYRLHKGSGFGPLTPNSKPPEVSEGTREFLDTLVRHYIKFDANQLELATHRETPWKVARAGIAPDEPSTNEITVSELKRYFKSRLTRT
jgi:uncharacterized phage-associated protein